MEKPKFRVGDSIVPIQPGRGIEKAVVTRIDGNSYYLKIMHGIAVIPISSQAVYKLDKDKEL